MVRYHGPLVLFPVGISVNLIHPTFVISFGEMTAGDRLEKYLNETSIFISYEPDLLLQGSSYIKETFESSPSDKEFSHKRYLEIEDQGSLPLKLFQRIPSVPAAPYPWPPWLCRWLPSAPR